MAAVAAKYAQRSLYNSGTDDWHRFHPRPTGKPFHLPELATVECQQANVVQGKTEDFGTT